MSNSELIIYLPLITAVLTALVTATATSLFTSSRDKKSLDFSKRIFIDYGETVLQYPFSEKIKQRHGPGIILWGPNGKKLKLEAEEFGTTSSPFLIIKNNTGNDVVNVQVKSSFSSDYELIEEEFSLPFWKSDDSLFIPQRVFEANNSFFSTNEVISVMFTTTSFETLKYELKKVRNGNYKERLQKKCFGVIWITKIKYHQRKFFSYEKIAREKKE